MIQEQLVPHYDYNNNFLGDLGSLQNLELRCYIAENRLEGYYLIYNDEKIIINSKGDMIFPNGLYDQELKLFSKLFKLQQKIRLYESKNITT